MKRLGDKNLSIIHISDIHLGLFSISKDAESPEAFEDFFSLLEDQLKKAIEDESVKCAIITGDITSKGIKKYYTDSHFERILNLFTQKQIPILICNGNHDLKRNLIYQGEQFQYYVDIIKKKLNFLNCSLSNKFDKNQISYILLPNYNTILLSLNSCQYIKENEGKHSNSLNLGVLRVTDIREVIDELKKKYSNTAFENMNKFLVCHHDIRSLEQAQISLSYLKSQNIKFIFSGHIHRESNITDNDLGITNFTAGSLLSNIKSRIDNISMLVHQPQYNLYTIDLFNGTIQPKTIKYTDKAEWNTSNGENIAFHPILSFDIEVFSEIHNIPDTLKSKLKTLGFDRFNVDPFYDFLMTGSQGKSQPGWIIDNDDTQEKVDLIKEWIIKHFDEVEQGLRKVIIIKNTKKFLLQLPKELLIGDIS